MGSCNPIHTTNRDVQSVTRWYFCLLCIFASFSAGIDLYGAESQRAKRVLVISTGSRFSIGFPIVEQNAVEELRRLHRDELEFYSEYLDIVRFPRKSYRRVFHDYLRDKYADDIPDLIVLIYVGNLNVGSELLGQIFPDTPVVAVGLTEEEFQVSPSKSRVTGIAQRSDPGGTMAAVLRLQPEIRRIVLIGGSAEVDHQAMSRAKQAARSFAGKVEFEVWEQRSIQEILNAVTSLPPRTAILFTRMFRDGAGRATISAQAARSIASASNVPVYVMSDNMIGTGAVGGSVADIAALGKRAGELADRVLSGVEPRSLPFVVVSQGVPIFDWHALKRWAIREDRLPQNSIVRSRPESTWEQYSSYIIAGLVIISLQAAMIAALLLQRARRRRAEAALSENRQFMELATEAGGIGLWVRDLLRGDLWANPRLRALFGFGDDEVLGIDDFLARIHPDDRAEMLPVVERAEATGLPFEVEFRTAVPGAPERWIAARGQFVRGPQGELLRRMGTMIDITEAKRAEQNLRESEERFRTVANAAPVMIWMSGADKGGTFFNKGWLDFTGRPAEREVGIGWTEGVHKDDFARCLEIYSHAFDARREFTMEYRLRRYDGEYRWLLDLGVPRFAPDGVFLGYIGCAIDITGRKRAESELQRHRDELAHIARVSTLGELGASLAHELNQPLTAILSNAQAAQRFLASNPADLDEVGEILKDIVKDDHRASEVIQRLRALVKKEVLAFALIELPSVINEVVQLLHSDAILHSVQVDVESDPGLPLVRGDPVQLQQVMLNLLLNAMDSMKNCPVDERRVIVGAQRYDRGFLRVAVRDQGVGLTADRLEKIFQPFYSTKRDGLGMGLAISRSIVEAHGGLLWAESNLDRGATFYFTVAIEKSNGGISVEGRGTSDLKPDI